MKAVVWNGPFDVRVGKVDDCPPPGPGAAVISVQAAGICGTDLWFYRGQPALAPGARLGHEFVGRVHSVGPDVASVRPGDFVIAPFTFSDGTCENCAHEVYSACENGAPFGSPGIDGGQGEQVLVPFADATLVAVPAPTTIDELADALALCDVYSTGLHGVRSAAVGRGDAVVVVGDGAVGLSAVLAAHVAGAASIILLSRHGERARLGASFGATEVIGERGPGAVDAVRTLLPGGADGVIECVGTQEALDTALGCVRSGGRVGTVGLPHGTTIDLASLFARNITVAGGMSSPRATIHHARDALASINAHPGAVFTHRMRLDEAPEGYRLMHERRAIKVMLAGREWLEDA
ncbi:threonine dehydrogenase-like Zn-dependent dehydrogenase [Microbacterium sp. SORGH_AS 1204]|uniref:zinc-binding dehydrogenase n=1 Tax=Microbacterium sp. SORGH_AS_1204 TaxID=3041785 RepID=UPI00279495AC|nr:alcohol dehydrogenase catalytic domain-containing protein [Microbacterium sp. SORGH_AS_1204]MDQ1136299.1 threonine dehydrogenase-like Zn-dependent dehydrogenase [Microbacterium sp. SORGH_AS_1204]